MDFVWFFEECASNVEISDGAQVGIERVEVSRSRPMKTIVELFGYNLLVCNSKEKSLCKSFPKKLSHSFL